MKKIMLSLVLLPMMAAAQETYTNAELLTHDLNGTARYVGMGGAMDALGVDLSVIGTNPAGIGLFRRSQGAVSAGFLSQPNVGYKYGDETNASFDQIGFVWSAHTPRDRHLNIAFNYHKSRNFNSTTAVEGVLNGASANKHAFNSIMSAYAANSSGDWLNNTTVSQLDALYYKTFLGEKDGTLGYNNGTRYTHSFATEGYVADYDINISGNVSNRVYLGVTFGFSDVNYRSYSTYSEQLVDANDNGVGSVTVDDRRHIDGTGFKITGGIIFFPIEDNPLRIGVSIATPTWYWLTARSWTALTDNTTIGVDALDPTYSAYGEYDYRVYTPWRFGVSAGYTFGNYLAVGITYDYEDYSTISSRYENGDDYYYYVGSSTRDREMNAHTSHTLKGVSTVKVGIEGKPTRDLALRAGYNYLSSIYREDGFRDPTVASLGTYYSSRYDYVNWQETHRVTFGIGYTLGHFAIDLAYQYNVCSGTYYPFSSTSSDNTTTGAVANSVSGQDITQKRHQFLATLSYKF